MESRTLGLRFWLELFSGIGRADLALLIEQNRVLHTYALPVMETLYEQIVNTHNMVILTDTKGSIIERRALHGRAGHHAVVQAAQLAGKFSPVANLLRTAIVMVGEERKIWREHMADDFLEDAGDGESARGIAQYHLSKAQHAPVKFVRRVTPASASIPHR
jgi:hypothetical protein